MIIVVCKANYCRSPVAEKILQSLLPNKNIKSYGIINFPKASMDSRSRDFLKQKGIDNLLHVPKKISQNDINQADIILPVDSQVLFSIVHNFKVNCDVRLFGYFNYEKEIQDPIGLNTTKEYFDIMDKLEENSLKWADYFTKEG